MLLFSTPIFSGCPGDLVVAVGDADPGAHVALTAGFCSPTVAALPSLTGVGGEHDGGDAVDGVPPSVSVPRSVDLPDPEPWVGVHGLVPVPLLPFPLLSPPPTVDIRPGCGVPKHPVDSAGECEVGVVPLLPVPLLAVLLSVLLASRSLIWHSAGASSTPPPPPAPVSELVHLVSFIPSVARDDDDERSPPDVG